MKSSISVECQHCCHDSQIEVGEEVRSIQCSSCKTTWQINRDSIFKKCPICGCPYFYGQKDFNKVLGLAIMFVGVCLAPFTYCLSLPVLSFFDWLLYRRVPNMVVCYDCRSEFRGFEVPADMEGFKHFLAEKFEKENT